MLSSSRSGGRGARGRRQPTIMDSPSFHSLSFLVDVFVFVFVFSIYLYFFADDKNFPDKTRPSFANPKERGVIGPASL